jgi:predicted ATP-binding protein involved in virulence
MFPKVQFIVATHSPAVIASIDNATVYDLSQHKTVDEDLRGYPYQFLMKEHFGIESEYSIAATKLLNEAKALMAKGNERTEQESNKLRELAKQLHELSPNLAFELFLELERQQLEVA